MKSYKSVDAMFKAMKRKNKKFRKEHPIIDRLETFYYRILIPIKDFPREAYRTVQRFIQRGKRGYCDEDTWGLARYLSRVISKSLYHFKNHHFSLPNDLTEGQWIDILNKMIYTFEIAERLGDDLFLIRDSKQREKFQKTCDKINEKYKTHDRCLSTKSIKMYDAGWKLFKEYFNYLWD